MKDTFDFLRATRANTKSIIQNRQWEQLHRIPKGFSNNLYWNVGHLEVTQHLFIYGLSGLPLPLPGWIMDTFRKGTHPPKDAQPEQLEELMNTLQNSPQQLQQDFESNQFKNFHS